MLEVRLFGTFAIQRGGQIITFPSRAAQSLFAYLILSAGTQHRREKLAGMFWPEATETKARTYLRHTLWQIRKAISPNSQGDYLLTDDITILFNASAEYWLDVEALTKLGDDVSADELIEAVSTYQGELLPGFYEDWILLEREHLQVVHEQNMTRLLELLEHEKRWTEILEWAEKWLSLGEAPEAAYRFLMIAYNALGDRAKMRAAYDRCVQVLRDLDLEPSEETRALVSMRAPTLNVPIPLTSFIGREKELKEVAGLLSRSRLVTLTGSGGAGKTRLAIQVASEIVDLFPDGIWFLDLAPLDDAKLVPKTLAGLLRLHDPGDLPVTRLLINYFRSRKAIVIFDNCEHVIEASADLIHTLLASCENLSVLATSRESLRVSGEIPYRVPSLETPNLETASTVEQITDTESVRLFLERAVLVAPGVGKEPEDIYKVAQICQRLDGIPLAIELAAVRLHMLSLDQVLKRLDDRFNLLTGGLRSSLPRHQTLRATIEWSYDLLSDKERVFFNRLSVFSGGWTLDAAENVCSGNGIESGEVLDLMDHLISKSLVIADAASERNSERNALRYRSLETIRQFGREMFQASGEASILHEKHLMYFLSLAEQGYAAIHGPDAFPWIHRLEREIDNFRSALEWSVTERNYESALRLLVRLSSAWGWEGHFLETCSWFERICSLTTIRDYPELHASLLNHLGWENWLRGNLRYAQSVLQEGREIWLQLGPRGEQGLAQALDSLGIVTLYVDGDKERTRSFFEQSLELFRKHDDVWGMSKVTFNLGHLAEVQGRFEEAENLYRNSLAAFRELGDQYMVAFVYSGLGDLARVREDYEWAEKYHEQTLEIFQQQRGRVTLAWPYINLGWVSIRRTNYRKARNLLEESLQLAIELDNKGLIGGCLAGFASILAMTGKPEQAARLFGTADSLSESLGPLEPADQKDQDYYTGLVRGQLDQAVFEKAWNEGRAMSLDEAIAYALAESK